MTSFVKFRRTSVVYVVLIVVSLTMILPFYWMVVTSLRSDSAIFHFPPNFLLHHAHPINYVHATQQIPFFRYLLNSTMLGVFNVVGSTISCVIVGYGVAKVQWKGRNVVFAVMLSTLFLPGAVTLAPSYIIFHAVHWTGTYLPLIVPPFFATAFNIFLIRQFFRGIPDALIEAAKIDGASHWRILWRIVVPLSWPAIGAVSIFSFVASWDSFLTPLIYLVRSSMFTLPIGLDSFVNTHGTLWNQLMAAGVMFMVPMLVIFFIGQKAFFGGGIRTSGIKG
jgi:multiple sugar transport system permease protein